MHKTAHSPWQAIAEIRKGQNQVVKVKTNMLVSNAITNKILDTQTSYLAQPKKSPHPDSRCTFNPQSSRLAVEKLESSEMRIHGGSSNVGSKRSTVQSFAKMNGVIDVKQKQLHQFPPKAFTSTNGSKL